jgi:hypothetical protein
VNKSQFFCNQSWTNRINSQVGEKLKETIGIRLRLSSKLKKIPIIHCRENCQLGGLDLVGSKISYQAVSRGSYLV